MFDYGWFCYNMHIWCFINGVDHGVWNDVLWCHLPWFNRNLDSNLNDQAKLFRFPSVSYVCMNWSNFEFEVCHTWYVLLWINICWMFQNCSLKVGLTEDYHMVDLYDLLDILVLKWHTMKVCQDVYLQELNYA